MHAIHNCMYNASAEGDVELPATYNGRVLRAIPDEAFKGRTQLTHVSIPESVVTIGNNAFSLCSNLEDISIPSGVSSIGILAFNGVPHVNYRGALGCKNCELKKGSLHAYIR